MQPPTPNTDNTGCFGNFSLRGLLALRARAQTSNPEIRPMNIAEATEPKGHDHCHGLCSGGDWARFPGRNSSFTAPPQYETDDTKRQLIDEVVARTIENKLDAIDSELREVSLKIHGNPELAFEERIAHDEMTEFMERHGFTVTRHYAGLETAWRAEYAVRDFGRVIGVNSEMDALPGIGHACGHNLIGICGMGIAVALKHAMVEHDLPGKVICLGTPAEEFGGGKIILLERGAYKEMDVCIMAHPATGPPNASGDGSMAAAQFIIAKFKGRPAHAAAVPWEGINAMDAAVIAYNGLSSLRQQLRPELRIHGFISGHDLSANTIPDNAQMTYIVRTPTRDDLFETVERLENCFRAGALATGCEIEIEKEAAYYDLRNNRVLAREYANITANRYGMIMDHTDVAASTDFGNVSYEIPGFHPLYSIPTAPTAFPHTPGFTHYAGAVGGQSATIQVAKGLALTGIRVIYDRPFYEEIKAAFEADRKMSEIAKKLQA